MSSLRKITATLKIKENDLTLAPYMVHVLLKALKNALRGRIFDENLVEYFDK